ncbi:MAG: O-antigen ligase family protein [Clostridia bacterium]|nr:O-antigen ligase family protein [Clostridia bacterium]
MAKKKKQNDLEYRQSLSEMSQWVALFFMSIFLLIPGTHGAFYNITESRFWYFFIVAMIYLAFIIYVISIGYKKIDFKTFIKPSISQYFVLGYMVWSLFCAIISKYDFFDTLLGHSRQEALLSIWAYGILFIFISEFAEHSNWYLYGFIVMATVEGIIATMHVQGSTVLFPGEYNYFNSHFIGTIGNVDCYSNIAALIIPALFAAYVFMENKIRFLALPAITLLFYSHTVTHVDCGKVGLVVAFAFSVILTCDTLKGIGRTLEAGAFVILGYDLYRLFDGTTMEAKVVNADETFKKIIYLAIAVFALGVIIELIANKTKARLFKPAIMRIIILVLVVVIAVVAIKFVYNYEGENGLIKEFSMAMHGEWTDRMGSNRGYIWKWSLELIKQKPITGYGPGTYALAFEPYDEGYMQLQANTIVDEAHNDYIHIAVCQGIVGLVLYLAYVISLLVRGIIFACKAGKTDFSALAKGDVLAKEDLEKKARIATIYMIGIVGFLAAVFFVFSIAIVSPIYWTMAALLEHLIKTGNQSLENK